MTDGSDLRAAARDGAVVSLRPFVRSDAAALAALANDANVSRYLRAHFPHPYAVADAEAFLTAPRGSAVLVDGVLAGGVAIFPAPTGEYSDAEAPPGAFELGYWLGTAFWGRGVGTAASRLALAAAAAGRQRTLIVVAGVARPNVASAALARKLGFTLAATKAAGHSRGGVVHDLDIYHLTVRPSQCAEISSTDASSGAAAPPAAGAPE